MAMTTHMADTPPTEGLIVQWRQRIRQTTFANYHFEMGFALWRTGSLDVAVAALERALEIQPDLAKVAPLLARIEEAQGHGAAAQRRKDVVLNRDPLLWNRGCVALALCHARDGAFDQAERWLEQARTVMPDDTLLLACSGLLQARQNAWLPACASLDRVTALADVETDELASELIDSLELMARHRFQDWSPPQPDKTVFALAAARAVLRLDSRMTALRGLIIRCLLRLGRYADVMQEFAELPTEQAAENGNRMLAGIALFSLGRYEEATTAFEACSAFNPNEARPIAYLGLIALATGENGRALAQLDAARLRVPGDAFVLSCYGLALHAQGRLADAVQTHEAALKLASGDVWARLNLGLALDALGDVCGSNDAYRAALESGAPFCFATLDQRPFGRELLKERFASLGFPYKAA